MIDRIVTWAEAHTGDLNQVFWLLVIIGVFAGLVAWRSMADADSEPPPIELHSSHSFGTIGPPEREAPAAIPTLVVRPTAAPYRFDTPIPVPTYREPPTPIPARSTVIHPALSR
jgi:hypothetical protein